MPKALNVGVFLSGYVDASGLPLTEGTVTFYDTDWSTLKTIWLDDNQDDEAPNPFTLRDNGTGIVFASGTYNLLIKDSTGATVDSVPGVQFTPFDPSADINFIDASTFGPKNDTTIQLAIDSAMGEDFRIYLSRGNWLINNDLTIPSNIEIDFEYGAYMTVPVGITLDLNGVVPEATLYPFFQGLGTINYDARNNFIPTIWKPGGVYGNTDLTGVWSLTGTLNTIGTANTTGQLNADNLRLDGNTISSTNMNGDINLIPNGTGVVVIPVLSITTFEAGNIGISGNSIVSTDSNGDINITPNGTGESVISNAVIDTAAITTASIGLLNVDNLRLDGNTISTTNSNGDMVISPNGTGVVSLPANSSRINIGTLNQTSIVPGSIYGSSQMEVQRITFEQNGATFDRIYTSGVRDLSIRGSSGITWIGNTQDIATSVKINGTQIEASPFKGTFTSSDGSAGATGSFTTGGAFTITVKNGLITAIV